MESVSNFHKYSGKGRSSHERLNPRQVMYIHDQAKALGYKPGDEVFPQQLIERFSYRWASYKPELTRKEVDALLRHMMREKLTLADFLD